MNNKRFMAEGGFEPVNPEAVSGCGHEIFLNNVGWYVQITYIGPSFQTNKDTENIYTSMCLS